MIYESIGKRIWRVIYPILTHIVIYALALFGASIICANLGYSPQQANAAMNRHAALITAIALVVTIPVLYFFYRKDYPVKSNLFFKQPKNILLVIALAVTASHGLSLLLSLFAGTGLAEGYENVEAAIYASSPLMVIIRGVLLAPVCEELLFRGLVFRRLKEYTGFWAASIISSVIFAVYHLNLIQGIFAFIFGMILCLVYDRFQNLWANIILHAAGNLLSVLLTYSMFQYPSMVLYIIVMAVFLLLAAWICTGFVRQKKEEGTNL